MKKIIIMTLLLLLMSLTINANEDDKVKACRLLSEGNKFCEVNEEGECECSYYPQLKGKDVQGGKE